MEREKFGVIRICVVGIALILQVLLFAVIFDFLRGQSFYIYFAIQMIVLIDIIFLEGKNNNKSFVIAWLVLVYILPVFGQVLYLMWGRGVTRGRRSKKIKAALDRGANFLKEDNATCGEFSLAHPDRKRISEYLARKGFPLYTNTKCDYFPLGEQQIEAMLKDIENAEKFVFLEYFIISSGKVWDRFEEVMIRKAKEGVEVRLLFDDMGSVTTASKKSIKNLINNGVQVKRFSPVHRYIYQLSINYRNHQKITVIDGNIGYTGGINIADEYANLYPKLGHWKDTAIRLEGDAVWGFLVSFIQMWETESKEQTDYEAYRPTESAEGEGYYQPFVDGPMNSPDSPAEVMYRTMINNAKDYVYITTPYLVIDNTMTDALATAALSGTDVRIITPKIWDHWYVHFVTQSNYEELLRAGVKIYEYTPGYIHAKTIISDDDNAIVGSINMDYRSFYLNYENGVWICGGEAIGQIKKDLMDTFAISEEIKLEDWKRRPWYVKFMQALLRLFAVLF